MCMLSCRQNKQVIKLNCKAIRTEEKEEKQKMVSKIFVSCTYGMCVYVCVCVSAIVCNVICGTAACYTHCKLTISFKLQTRQADKIRK